MSVLFGFVCNTLIGLVCDILFGLVCDTLFGLVCNTLFGLVCNTLFGLVCNIYYLVEQSCHIPVTYLPFPTVTWVPDPDPDPDLDSANVCLPPSSRHFAADIFRPLRSAVLSVEQFWERPPVYPNQTSPIVSTVL